jgi:hypothetical protein
MSDEINSYNPYETFSDLLLSVLIIFLLLIVLLSLDVTKSLHEIKSQNTKSGGIEIPILYLRPVGENGQLLYYFSSRRNAGQPSSISDIHLVSMLAAIDPGKVEYNNEERSLMKLFLMPRFGSDVVSNEDLEDLRKINSMTPNPFDIITSEDQLAYSRVIKRPAIHYNSDQSMNEIVIGNTPIKVEKTHQLAFLIELTTSYTDLVYIGEYSREDRLAFYKKIGGHEAEAYYLQWLNTNNSELSLKDIVPPGIKYPEVFKAFLKEKRAMDIKPSVWVEENFLYFLTTKQS